MRTLHAAVAAVVSLALTVLAIDAIGGLPPLFALAVEATTTSLAAVLAFRYGRGFWRAFVESLGHGS